MAQTNIHSNNQKIAFIKKELQSYVRENLFSPYMTGDNNIIRKFSDIDKAMTGDQINVPIIANLVGGGVGIGTLVGNEEKIDNYGQRVWADWARNGPAIPKSELQKASFDIWRAKMGILSQWGKDLMRDEIVLALNSIPSEAPPVNQGAGAGVRVNGLVMSAIPTNQRSLWVPASGNYASAGQLNTWHTDNSDRIVCGHSDTNYVAGNHASSLANLSVASSLMSSAIVTRARDKARLPTPLVSTQMPGSPVQPYRGTGVSENYVMFCGQRAFAALKQDTAIYQANRDARSREGNGMKDNPIFMAGDLLWDGVIIREIPEITKLALRAGVGASGANVEPFFLCGQSALAVAWGQEPQIKNRTETDYGFVQGAALETFYGISRVARRSTNFGGSGLFKDLNIVTGFVAVQ